MGDFPHDVQKAIISYTKFGDRSVPDLGYLGKDFTLFEQILEIEKVIDKELYLETLIKMDSFYIEKNYKDIEAARKKNSSGKS